MSLNSFRSNLKPKLFFTDRLLESIFSKFIPPFVMPNHITIVRFALIPVVALLLVYGYYIIGGITFVFAAFTDALDGMIARTRREITDWGKLFDPLADKLLMFTTFIILAIPRIQLWVIVSLFAIEIIFIIAGLIYHKLGRHPQANNWGKMKMFLEVVAVIILFLSIIFEVPLLITVSTAVLILAIIFAIISLITQGI